MPEALPERLDEYAQQHPADLADALERLAHPEEAVQILRRLPKNSAADAFAELEPEAIREFSTLLTEKELAAILEQLPHSKATDIIGELPPERQQGILETLPAHTASPLRNLLQYPDDTAGGIMSDQYIALNANGTIADALNQLRQNQQAMKEITYLYVTDNRSKLIGVASFRDLVLRPQNEPIQNITNTRVTRLNLTDDQEEIARQFERYHFLGLPVVDAEERLVGVVNANQAIQIAREEATEDMQLMVGVSGEEHTLTPWHKAVGKRLPWLYVNLATAFAAAAVVSAYESTIAQWTVLAVFLPIIAGQGGNAGMQTLTIIIRDLALGELNLGDGRRAILKELSLGLVNGIAIGAAVGIAGFLWKGDATLGFIIGIAMILNQLTAALAGVMIPLTLKWLRIDPALASSIFLTTLTDIGGFFFFLWLAAYALQQ